MRDILIDENWEIDPFATMEGPDELTQAIRVLLNTEQGDFPIEPRMGLPMENILYNFNEQYAKVDLEEALLLHEPRVTGIDEITMTLNPPIGHLGIELIGIQADLETHNVEVAIDVE